MNSFVFYFWPNFKPHRYSTKESIPIATSGIYSRFATPCTLHNTVRQCVEILSNNWSNPVYISCDGVYIKANYTWISPLWWGSHRIDMPGPHKAERNTLANKSETGKLVTHVYICFPSEYMTTGQTSEAEAYHRQIAWTCCQANTFGQQCHVCTHGEKTGQCWQWHWCDITVLNTLITIWLVISPN